MVGAVDRGLVEATLLSLPRETRKTIPTMTAAITTTMMPLRICLRRFWRFASARQSGLPAPRRSGGLSCRWARPETLPDPGGVRIAIGRGRTPGARVPPSDGAVCSLVRMPLVVQKFGGTSVGDADRIRAVADHIARTRRQGNDVVAVVSAMGKTTDDLIHLADSRQRHPAAPRVRHAASAPGSGSRCRCWCMALADLGVDAASFTGSQVGIITDNDHTRAKILEVKARPPARGARPPGRCPVVAGFQGVSTDREITTLGPRRLRRHRGGAGRRPRRRRLRDLHRRHRGLHAPTPGSCPRPTGINRISFEEMLEMAATGGRVLMLRAVEFARNHNVPLHVRSSFTWEPGTWVVEEDADMEEAVVTAVTHDTSEAKVTVSGVPGPPRAWPPGCSGPWPTGRSTST